MTTIAPLVPTIHLRTATPCDPSLTYWTARWRGKFSHGTEVTEQSNVTDVVGCGRRGRSPGLASSGAVITALHHVQLAMPRGAEAEAEAERFYGGVLGFVPVPKPPALAGRGGRWFQSGSAHVHLGVEDDFRPARKAHPAFVVQDLDALQRVLRLAGVVIEAGEQLPGSRRCYVADPFGNRIELIEPEAG
jgi:catechol 2,3-dioxygenase-like lactoylglutathione lyase family enzyme